MFQRISINLLLLCFILAINGCMFVAPQPVPHPAPKPAPAKPVPKPVINMHRGEINALLALARFEFKQNRLTTPSDSNAYLYYTRVLAIDPANKAAKQGIYDIAEKYLEWAIDNATAGNYRTATNFLGKARSLDPDQPNIPAVTRLIKEHENASKMTYYLQIDGLDQKAQWVVSELHDIGHTVDSKHATVVITARSDAEGQWIYQQMNEVTPDRIHARLKIGDKPRVRLIY